MFNVAFSEVGAKAGRSRQPADGGRLVVVFQGLDEDFKRKNNDKKHKN